MVKHWSKRQAVIALSSGEAELYGICRGAAEAMGMSSTMGDYGRQANICLATDSNAAIGICKRQGLGKLRHVAVQDLWIQQVVSNGRVVLGKIAGEINPADVLTKPTAHSAMAKHLARLSFYFDDGRSNVAPKLAS